MNPNPQNVNVLAAVAAAGAVLLLAVTGVVVSAGGSSLHGAPGGATLDRRDISIDVSDRIPEAAIGLGDREMVEKTLVGKTFVNVIDPAVTISFTRAAAGGHLSATHPLMVQMSNGCNVFGSPARVTDRGVVELAGVTGTRVNCVMTQEKQVQDFLSAGSFSIWAARNRVFLVNRTLVLGFRPVSS